MSKDKSGKSLEKAVARIQQMLDPGSTVTHDVYIVDRLKNRRQFDVVIRGQAAGRDYLGVIEAKDWSNKIGTPEVEAFVAKARNVNANFILMVSKMGFSEPGLKLARHEGVGTLSLLPDDPMDAGFCLGINCYANRYEWGECHISVFGKAAKSPPGAITDVRSITLEGKPVIDWFAKQLSTTYTRATGPEPTRIEVNFKTATRLQVEGKSFDAAGLVLTAKRIRRTKRGFVQVTGDAFYDWQDERISWPIGGALRFELSDEMVNSWEFFTGEVPAEDAGRTLVYQEFIAAIDPQQDVVDLEKYC